MATSNSTNFDLTANQICTSALRKCNVIGEGETPSTAILAEALEVLNVLLKSLESAGMPLWRITEYTLTPVAGTASYTVGTGATVSQHAPLKIHQAWNRVSNNDSPLIILPYHDYNMLGNKTSPGTPSQIYYKTPAGPAGSEMVGTVYLYPVPDANFVTTNSGTIKFTGTAAFQDADSSSNNLDFPSCWLQAIIWGVADQMCYQVGVPLAERAMIAKKAQQETQMALNYGTEEGSFRIWPSPDWQWETY